MKKKIGMKYALERGYPYILAALAAGICRMCGFNMMDAQEYCELLDGLVTLDAIIIGFLGAIIPVLLSMKKESALIRYVLLEDKENLLVKYLKSTIWLGLLSAVLSLFLHLRSMFSVYWNRRLYDIWLFAAVAFFLATYRYLSHMIVLIFESDEKGQSEENVERPLSDERRAKLREQFGKESQKKEIRAWDRKDI